MSEANKLHWTQDWVFEPKDDITALEVAKVLQQVKLTCGATVHAGLTDDVKRHFVLRQVRG